MAKTPCPERAHYTGDHCHTCFNTGFVGGGIDNGNGNGGGGSGNGGGSDTTSSTSSPSGAAKGIGVLLGLFILAGTCSKKDEPTNPKPEPERSSPTRSEPRSTPRIETQTYKESAPPREEPIQRPQQPASKAEDNEPIVVKNKQAPTPNSEITGETLFNGNEIEYYMKPGNILHAFHAKEMTLPVSHIEYNKSSGELVAVTPFNIRHYLGPALVSPEMKEYMNKADRVLVVRTKDQETVSGFLVPLYFSETRAYLQNHIFKRPEDGAAFFVPYLNLLDSENKVTIISSWNDLKDIKQPNAFRPWRLGIAEPFPDFFKNAKLNIAEPLFKKVKPAYISGEHKDSVIIDIDISDFADEHVAWKSDISHVEYDILRKTFYIVDIENRRQRLMPRVSWDSNDTLQSVLDKKWVVFVTRSKDMPQLDSKIKDAYPFYYRPKQADLKRHLIERPYDGARLIVNNPIYYDFTTEQFEVIKDYSSLVRADSKAEVLSCAAPFLDGSLQNMKIESKIISIDNRIVPEFNYSGKLGFPVSHVEILDGMFPVFAGTDGKRVISCQQISREAKNYIDSTSAADLFKNGVILSHTAIMLSERELEFTLPDDKWRQPQKVSFLVPLFAKQTAVSFDAANQTQQHLVVDDQKIMDCRIAEADACHYLP